MTDPRREEIATHVAEMLSVTPVRFTDLEPDQREQMARAIVYYVAEKLGLHEHSFRPITEGDILYAQRGLSVRRVTEGVWCPECGTILEDDEL